MVLNKSRSNMSRWIFPVIFALLLLTPIIPMTSIVSKADPPPRGSIVIRGDDEFTSENGVSGGSGSSTDPYIINDLVVAAGGTGVTIQNTRKHVVFDNVTLTDENGAINGFSIINVTNLTITRSSMTDLGINVEHSRNVEISWCSIVAGKLGLYYSQDLLVHNVSVVNVTMGRYTLATQISYCEDILFIDNNLTIGRTGLNLWYNRNITVARNEISGFRSGMYANSYYAHGPWLFEDNEVFDCQSGMAFNHLSNLTVSRNYVNSTTERGITFKSCLVPRCDNNTIQKNGVFLQLDEMRYGSMEFSDNTLGGLPIYLYTNLTGRTLSPVTNQAILVNCSNCTVRDLKVSSSPNYGVALHFSNDTTVVNCSFTDVFCGIGVVDSSRTSLVNVAVDGNTTGVEIIDSPFTTIEGSSFTDLVHCIGSYINTNLSVRNSTFTSSEVGLAHPLSNTNGFSYNMTITGCNFSSMTFGIEGENFRTSSFHGNTFSANGVAIRVEDLEDSSISSNMITGPGDHGIEFYFDDIYEIYRNVSIDNNTISMLSMDGIIVDTQDYGHGKWLNITNNRISNVRNGMNLTDVRKSTNIRYNLVSDCAGKGCILRNSDEMSIIANTFSRCEDVAIDTGGFWKIGVPVYHNNFINNNRGSLTPVDSQVIDITVKNGNWDNGTHGNYWSDYAARYPDATNNGFVWDTPYEIYDYRGVIATQDSNPLVTEADLEPPMARVKAPHIIDEGTMVTFDGLGSSDNVGIVRYTWTFTYNDEPVILAGYNVSFLFDIPGNYDVTLSVHDMWGNFDEAHFVLIVQDIHAPIADAGPDLTVDQHEWATLNGSRSSDSSGLKAFIWYVTMGDDSRILDGELTSIYCPIAGSFNVTLQVFDAYGSTSNDTLVLTVRDRAPPSAVIPENATLGQNEVLVLNGSMSTDNVGIVSWIWTVEDTDGTHHLEGEVVEYVYRVAGTYLIILNVTDAAGNWAEVTVEVTVTDTIPPKANAGKDIKVDEGETVTIDGRASADNVGIAKWNWSMTIGNETVRWDLSHFELTLEDPGDYQVDLIVFDGAGNSNEDSMTVRVRDTTDPVADAGGNMIAEQGLEFTFNGSASTDNVGVSTWRWSIEDGGLVHVLWGPTPTFVFMTIGKRLIELTVTDAAGNFAKDRITITVDDTTPPVAKAGRNIVIGQGGTAAFHDWDSTDNVGIEKWSWIFSIAGTDHTVFGRFVNFTFHEVGTYEVTMQVEDAVGLVAYDYLNVTVIDTTPPRAVFGPNMTVNMNEALTLDGSASTDNVGVVNWTWSFEYRDEPITMSGEALNWTFQKAGEYQILLTVTDGAGNENSTQGTIVVKDTSHRDGPPLWVYVVIWAVIIAIAIVVAFVILKGKWKGSQPSE